MNIQTFTQTNTILAKFPLEKTNLFPPTGSTDNLTDRLYIDVDRDGDLDHIESKARKGSGQYSTFTVEPLLAIRPHQLREFAQLNGLDRPITEQDTGPLGLLARESYYDQGRTIILQEPAQGTLSDVARQLNPMGGHNDAAWAIGFDATGEAATFYIFAPKKDAAQV